MPYDLKQSWLSDIIKDELLRDEQLGMGLPDMEIEEPTVEMVPEPQSKKEQQPEPMESEPKESKREIQSDATMLPGYTMKIRTAITYLKDKSKKGSAIPQPTIGSVFSLINTSGDKAGYVVYKISKNSTGFHTQASAKPAIKLPTGMLQIIQGQDVNLSVTRSIWKIKGQESDTITPHWGMLSNELSETRVVTARWFAFINSHQHS